MGFGCVADARHGIRGSVDKIVADRPQPLLDAEQAAALLNVPKTWVLAEARANRIPHVRLGRYVRFVGDELETWWLSRANGPWRSNGAAAAHARAVTPCDASDSCDTVGHIKVMSRLREKAS